MMSKSKKNKNAENKQTTKGYSDKTEQTATDSVSSNDNGSHAENHSDKSCQ